MAECTRAEIRVSCLALFAPTLRRHPALLRHDMQSHGKVSYRFGDEISEVTGGFQKCFRHLLIVVLSGDSWAIIVADPHYLFLFPCFVIIVLYAS